MQDWCCHLMNLFFLLFENSITVAILVGNKDPLLELDKIYYIGVDGLGKPKHVKHIAVSFFCF